MWYWLEGLPKRTRVPLTLGHYEWQRVAAHLADEKDDDAYSAFVATVLLSVCTPHSSTVAFCAAQNVFPDAAPAFDNNPDAAVASFKGTCHCVYWAVRVLAVTEAQAVMPRIVVLPPDDSPAGRRILENPAAFVRLLHPTLECVVVDVVRSLGIARAVCCSYGNLFSSDLGELLSARRDSSGSSTGGAAAPDVAPPGFLSIALCLRMAGPNQSGIDLVTCPSTRLSMLRLGPNSASKEWLAPLGPFFAAPTCAAHLRALEIVDLYAKDVWALLLRNATSLRCLTSAHARTCRTRRLPN
jgi:hypothetical protein